MKTKTEILDESANITVINDGQVQYPVLTAELDSWIATNGEITVANYEQFCDQVDYLGAQISTPGNAEMIELCADLIEMGASTKRPG